MKKILLSFVLVLITSSAFAQSEKPFYGVFNRIGVDINVGTQGVGVDMAFPVTKYLELSVGVNSMPAFKYSDDIKVGHITGSTTYAGVTYPYDIDAKSVDVKANLERTTGEVKLSFYPFGERNSLFVTGGFSFGGNRIARLSGYSTAIEDYYNNPNFTDVNGNVIPEAAKDEIQAEIDKYEFKFDKTGHAVGDIKVRKFRPYVGLGYGRLIPKKAVGFRVEAGVQFMGKMKIYQDGVQIDEENLVPDGNDDDLSKILDKVKVYPVLKFALTGRFL